MQLLPTKSQAPEGKPQGAKSLAQMIINGLMDGTLIVVDEHPSTPSAADQAGFTIDGRVCHRKEFRNPATGVHTNDVESEFARFKLWHRTKFAFVRVAAASESDESTRRANVMRKVMEYTFYTNVGRKMSDVMMAVRYSTS